MSKSGRLPASLIQMLVNKFIPATTDEARQTIVDQLGLNPMNHAEFMYRLMCYHNGTQPIGAVADWLAYRDLATRTFGNQEPSNAT